MNTVAALRVFIRVVERGSMTAAARDLGISQPAVSKILRELEGHMGTRLLHRSPRAMQLSEPGRLLYDATSGALSTIDAAIEDVRNGAGSITGDLHIHGPVCVGERHLSRIVFDFQSRHPQLRVSLTLEDRAINLIEDNIDLALCVGRPEAQNLIARRVGASRRILVAAPDYLARHGTPGNHLDLVRHGLIVSTTILSRQGTITLCRGPSTTEVQVHPVLTTNNPQVLVGALEAGRGIGTAQHLLVADHLASGRLVRALPQDEVEASELFLTYASAKFLRPVVRAFIDFLIPELRRIDGIV
ncbi:LysR family transcriptional regulator [Methylorubrum salsuginis]|uniref:DNA-binding transcriptional regulator, LysR family n=1 Tax=Methylorubrum salsuginis TaxID=414703 RepID=A0A1I4IK62_9HYPH|nr:LysR family transcriptional regulator [Methylorubrum salsuginis]SFL54191.1 DNA-binding transcriptional regulator, LysR family [Methylorubrum salsuginis]